MAPSTFASAAAGNSSSNSSGRQEGGNEWSRRVNGATQTFRRPSLATSYSSSNQPQTREANIESQQPSARYVPVHKNGPISDLRYSKEQLLELAKAHIGSGAAQRDSLLSLTVSGWEPDHPNGAAERGNGWPRKDEHRDPSTSSEAFWEHDGSVIPRGLVDLTEDERETFTSSVNSPLKQINTNTREGGAREGLPLRKISISHNPNSPGAFSMNSPSTTRPGGRRREPSESYPFPSNPLASPKARDENRTTSPPPALRRRATDFRENSVVEGAEQEPQHVTEDLEAKQSAGFPSRLMGGNPLSAGLGGPSSPWGTVQPSPGFAPMGAFGSLGAGHTASTPGEKRPGFGSGRAESRFKGLMSKDGNDDQGKSLKEKASVGNFGKASDSSSWRTGWPDAGRPGGDQDPDAPTGSAALGGGEEISPPPARGFQNLGTPQRPDTRDDFGFSAFGMTPDTGSKAYHDQQHGLQPRGQPHAAEAMSPTNTNPYQSPHQDVAENENLENDDADLNDLPLPGLGGLMNDELGPMPGHFGGGGGGFGGFSHPAGDRSQTSSAGPRGFSGLSGLGALPGLSGSSAWGGLQASTGTPTRERAMHSGFGDHFGSNDIQSPSLAGLGPSSFFGANQNAAPGGGRGISRMGTLFGQGPQEGRLGNDPNRPLHEDDKYAGAHPHHGALHGDDGDGRSYGQGSEGEAKFPGEGSVGSQASGNQALGQNQPPLPGSPSLNQTPAPQQKTMVMPDRMRWIYRDPQGNTQGPWSGLEMHDWYKAGFFSPELLVKKYEDVEYEPLAQLIRRIGNSREPFLVPQIGIPHGPAQSNWSNTGPLAATGGQPPFASSFPSFGTTLTADQQNALERRKQEEQYLMARQKEHLAQQQMAQRLHFQGPHGGGGGGLLPHQLQHHASAQSLHSQQSFGSVGSNHGYQAPSLHGSGPSQQMPGFFDNSFGGQNRGFGAVGGGAAPTSNAALDSLGDIREEDLPSELSKLGLNQHSFGHLGQGNHQQQVNQMLDDRSRLQQEQARHDAQFGQDDSFPDNRLQEFQQLQQAQRDQEEQQARQAASVEQRDRFHHEEAHRQQVLQTPTKEPKSLTEQVQQAVSAQQSPAAPWNKADPALPQPFPPAPSQSPLPAPAAQRNRSHVADALHAESHSRSETPSVETPTASIAPWAKEPAEPSRGPSLKEIQEAEAKTAAKAEALAAEVRRAALEREALAQIQAAAVAAATTTAGLPSSSTWASAGAASPTIPTPGSAWSKATKPAAATSTSAKSMAQIQKEEEARKKRLAAATVAAQQQAAALAGAAAQVQGKRYAELASKVASSASSSPNLQQPAGAWTTVGASGKVKGPVTPGPTPAVRTASGAVPPVAAANPAAVKKPVVTRTATSNMTVNAQEEFKRWAANELRGDLNKGVNAEEFISNLLAFPPEMEIVTEAVHSVSTTIDSRHFAEEFLKKRKMADKGVFENVAKSGVSGSPANGARGPESVGGGWSEVAKKSKEVPGAPVKEVLAGDFKVVAAKKKAGKR